MAEEGFGMEIDEWPEYLEADDGTDQNPCAIRL